MINKVAIFWLWWQGKQFIRFFKNNWYNPIGICKSKETKYNIEKEFWIEVYTNYKECLNNDIDLLVLCAYPIDIYKEVLEYSKIYNYYILSDLPITFDEKLLNLYLKNEKLYLFLLETKTIFFNKYYLLNKDKINKINCLVLQNKENLTNQINKKQSVIVDSHYMLNNLLWVDFNLLDINYKFVERKVKDVEYIIEIFLNNGTKIVYKYEDWKWITLFIDNTWTIIDRNIELIVFDVVLKEIIDNIKSKVNSYKKEYLKNFTYLLTNLHYENKNS